MPIKLPPLPPLPPVVRIIQGILNFIIPLVCCILEYQAIKQVQSEHESVCTQAREMSPFLQIFLLLVGIVIIPDIVFAVTVIVDLNNVARPLGVAYHACACGICAVAAHQLESGITYCGNPAQDSFHSATGLANAAAILHGVYILIVLWQIPPSEICHIPWIKKES